MSSSALPTVLQSASRRADFSGLPGSLLLRPAKLLAPCADLTRSSSGHRGFYLQASDESVTLLAAGYNYGSYWIVLSKGLSPFGMTASGAPEFSIQGPAKHEVTILRDKHDNCGSVKILNHRDFVVCLVVNQLIHHGLGEPDSVTSRS